MCARLVLTLACGLTASVAGATEKLPDSVLKSLLAVTAAVQSSCSTVKPSPSFLLMIAQYGKEAKQLTSSEAAVAEIRAEMSMNGELIAKLGCGRYADFWNERGKKAGLAFPVFVRD